MLNKLTIEQQGKLKLITRVGIFIALISLITLLATKVTLPANVPTGDPLLTLILKRSETKEIPLPPAELEAVSREIVSALLEKRITPAETAELMGELRNETSYRREAVHAYAARFCTETTQTSCKDIELLLIDAFYGSLSKPANQETRAELYNHVLAIDVAHEDGEENKKEAALHSLKNYFRDHLTRLHARAAEEALLAKDSAQSTESSQQSTVQKIQERLKQIKSLQPETETP